MEWMKQNLKNAPCLLFGYVIAVDITKWLNDAIYKDNNIL